MKEVTWRVAALACAFALPASAQQATPLAQLIQEAKANNSGIAAADHGARAARMVPAQKSVLPDPSFTVQQFSVGSPRPFAGYTNSDFAYIGVGASQELPYPGKLRLRAEVAERDADTKAAEAVAVGADVVDAV
jgi:outer membrane protein TolC